MGFTRAAWSLDEADAEDIYIQYIYSPAAGLDCSLYAAVSETVVLTASRTFHNSNVRSCTCMYNSRVQFASLITNGKQQAATRPQPAPRMAL